ncbi:MAG: bacterial Ig-like domain-containing protein [Bacilli bacterium]|nr:bacterial Ig-like domain-containing protein [Bacilli bacterium]
MKKILFLLLCLFVNANVSAYYSSDPLYNGGYVMPDLYNTGSITSKDELVDISVKYPEIACADMCRITTKIAEKYNYVFEGFTATKRVLINGVSNVTIRDFYIETTDYYGIQLVDWNNVGIPTNIVIEDGEINGTSSAAIAGSNVEIRRVYIHEYGGDGIKIGSNQLIESNYIASGGLNEGAHADGVQLTGSAHNVKIIGNRFDMVGTFDNYKANANLFLQLENGEASDVEVAHNWLNGGGYTIYVNEYQENMFTGIKFTDNKLGNGKRFGYMASNFTDAAKANIVGLDSFIYAEDENVPFVGSVVYKSDNRIINDLKNVNGNLDILVNVANYNSNEQNIVLVANVYNHKGELVNTYKQDSLIPRNMPGREYVTDKGEVLKDVSMSDFPQNVETVLSINDLPGDISGYSIKVFVYKSDNLNDALRTSNISNSVVREHKLIGINVESKKDTYEIGDIISKDDLIVTALYSDDTTEVVDDYTFDNTSLVLGSNTILVSYNGIDNQFEVIVVENPNTGDVIKMLFQIFGLVTLIILLTCNKRLFKINRYE